MERKRKMSIEFVEVMLNDLVERWRNLHSSCPECIMETDIEFGEELQKYLKAIKILKKANDKVYFVVKHQDYPDQWKYAIEDGEGYEGVLNITKEEYELLREVFE